MKYGEQFNPFGHYQGMFIPNCIAQSYLKDSSKLLLGRLFQYAGQNGKAFPFRDSLAKELHWEIRKLDRNIRYLKDEGLLETIQEKEDGPSTYIFLYHHIYEDAVKNGDGSAVKNGDGSAVKNNSGGAVKNNKQKNKYIKKKKKRLSKDNLSDSDESQKQREKPLIKKKCPKIVRKKDIPKKPKSKYNHSVSDLRNYNELKSCGITNHQAGTKAEIDSLDKLHALFDHRCKDPYYPIHIPEEFVDYEWSMDDLIEIFKFQLENAAKFNMKPIRAIGKFIFSEGFNGNKSWSPLLVWAQKMMRTDDSLTSEGERLFKIMSKNDIRDIQRLESSILNKVSKELKEKEKLYSFVDSTSCHINYPAGIMSVFVRYVKERANKLSFELVYITKKGFVDEFLHIAMKRNILKKKSNGRRGVNG